jgi:hypothetical protein
VSTAAPGWYPDHADPTIVRYWDGDRWTEHTHPAPQGGPPADAAAEAKEAARQQRQVEKAERARAKAEDRAQKKAEKQARAEDELARYGREVAWETFGGKSIRIYDGGYVKVGLLAGAGTPFQRLVSIEASSDVAKKSGLGRGAAAIATGGVNLLGSNKRGDVYLTIVTDEQTYALRESPPTAGNMTRVKKLEATGNAVLRQPVTRSPAAGEGAAPRTSTDGGDVRDRLRQLVSLHEEGLISAEELERKRAALLDEL